MGEKTKIDFAVFPFLNQIGMVSEPGSSGMFHDKPSPGCKQVFFKNHPGNSFNTFHIVRGIGKDNVKATFTKSQETKSISPDNTQVIKGKFLNYFPDKIDASGMLFHRHHFQ